MAKATIEFIATSGIHSEFLDKTFKNVLVTTNTIAKNVIFQTEDGKNIFLNPNYEIAFSQYGIRIEGFFLIENCLGSAVIIIKDYI
jgi:hypothetical protein